MASIFSLGANDKVGVFGPASVYGAAGEGAEKALIFSGASDVTVQNTVENIDFAGSSADYQFRVFLGSLFVTDKEGNVVATIAATSGQQLAFSDGVAAVTVGEDGSVTIGDQVFANGEAAADYTGGGLDDTQQSEVSSLGGGGEGGTGEGKSFELTSEPNSIAGTEGDDTVTGAISDLGSGDSLLDPSTSDNDTISLSGDGKLNVTGATILNFENLDIDYSGALNFDADLDTFTGLKEFSFDASNSSFVGTLTVENTGKVNVTAGAGVKKLNVSDVESSVISAGEATTEITVSGASGNGEITVNAQAATAKINVTDQADSGDVLTLTNLGEKVNLYASGADTVNLSSAGASEITVSGGAPLTKGSVQGGDITLVTADIASGDWTVESGTLNVRVTNTASGDYTKVAADRVILASGSSAGFKVAEGTVVELASEENVTIDTAKSVDVVVSATGASGAGATLTASGGSGDLNIELALASGDHVYLTALSGDASGTAVTVGGDDKLTVTTLTSIDSFDASAMTAALTVSNAVEVYASKTFEFAGSEGGSALQMDAIAASGEASLTFGAGKDDLTLTDAVRGDMVVNMGAGDDVLTVSSGGSVSDGTVIVDFGDGKDTLKLANGSNLTGGAAVTFAGLEVIDVTGAATTGATVAYESIAGLDLNVVGVSGSKLTVDLGADPGGKSFDLSGLDSIGTNNTTATMVVDMSGASGADLTIGTATYKVTVDAGPSIVGLTDAPESLNTITFTEGSVLQLVVNADVGKATFVNTSAATSFEAAVDAALGTSSAAVACLFTYGGKDYLVVETETNHTYDASTDYIVEIAGVEDLTTVNITV